MDWGVVTVQKSVQGQENGPMQLENRLGLSKSLLDVSFIMALLLDFLNSGSNRNHETTTYMSSLFCHFGKFFIFNSFAERIYLTA